MNAIITALILCALPFLPALAAAEPDTLSLDCGNGVTLDFVKIPAGTFVMGRPDPVIPTPDHEPGYFLIWSCVLVFLLAVAVIVVIARTIKSKKRFQISIFMLMLLTALAGSSLGTYWKELELRNAWVVWESRKEQAKNYEDADYCQDEKPAHEVKITRAFSWESTR